MNRKLVLENLIEVFKKVFEIDSLELKEEDSFKDIEQWDSLTHIMIVVELEKKFEIKFLSSELASWKKLGILLIRYV